MKVKTLFWIATVSFLLVSCGMHRYQSRFTENPPNLGVDKDTFMAIYGTPFRYNSYYDDSGALCEELIYREIIDHEGGTFIYGDVRAVNSIFEFRNKILQSQFQEDDMNYQIEKDRAKDRKLIEEQIKTDKERLEIQKERLEKESEK
ncbi:MAG: hypothetical protein GX857_04350 [Bacteroidales bacterium]|jgi:hypothetical protein|nr:hypothetical protein [Bacteroidales bacterium]